ncbi:MAG: hypothetical protein KJO69_08330 [Gammaproteobacteria bacterium]|nr:hypothetical protein [Gammaproteobacteria bacterium]
MFHSLASFWAVLVEAISVIIRVEAIMEVCSDDWDYDKSLSASYGFRRKNFS